MLHNFLTNDTQKQSKENKASNSEAPRDRNNKQEASKQEASKQALTDRQQQHTTMASTHSRRFHNIATLFDLTEDTSEVTATMSMLEAIRPLRKTFAFGKNVNNNNLNNSSANNTDAKQNNVSFSALLFDEDGEQDYEDSIEIQIEPPRPL